MKINNILNKIGYNSHKTHNFSKEFRTVIIVFICLRLVTMIISGFGSFDWYYYLLVPHVQNITTSLVISIVFCVLVELVVSSFLLKFWKFLFKGHISWSVMCFIGAALFLAIAFVATTNGLAAKQYKNKDKTSLLVDNSKVENENLKLETETKITEIRKNIELIRLNPAGWTGNKRNILTGDQLRTIKEYNNEIFKLQNQLRQDIERNENKLTNEVNQTQNSAKIEASKYYLIGVINIILQVISSLGLSFFWAKIYSEIASNDEKAADNLKGNIEIADHATDILIKNFLTNKFSALIAKTEHYTQNPEARIISVPENNLVLNTAPQETEKTVISETLNEPKTERKIVTGFGAGLNKHVTLNKSENTGENKENCNAKNENTYESVSKKPLSVTNSVTKNEVLTCKNCGKKIKIFKRTDKKFCNDSCRIEYHRKTKGFEVNKIKLYKSRKKK